MIFQPASPLFFSSHETQQYPPQYFSQIDCKKQICRIFKNYLLLLIILANKTTVLITDNLSLSGSSHEFSRHANRVIEEPDDPVVRQRRQSDDTAFRECGQHRVSARSSQPGHQETPDRAVHRRRRRRWRINDTHNNFADDVRDGVLRRLRLRRIRRESAANRSGSARPAGPKSGMIQRIRGGFDRRKPDSFDTREKLRGNLFVSFVQYLVTIDIFKSLLVSTFLL